MPSRQPLSSNPTQKTTIFFIIITTSASVIILLAILYFAYYLWYSLVRHSRTSPFDSSAPFFKLQRFTYKELKLATNGFSESNSIGKGGSGTVFKGGLKDGKLVAVKILDGNSLQGETEFQNELQILGGLRSPLIVNLLGYCVEKSKRIVVYEYMPNHSLQESLFSESDLSLNWGRRFDIITNVSKALAFLHLECDPPVIHGDVKPSNVLLDAEYRAKLSDFGLSRLKLDGEFGVDLFSQDLGKSQELWKSQDLSGNLVADSAENETPGVRTPVESNVDEVDFALALQASSSSKNSKFSHNVRSLGLGAFVIGDNNSTVKENETKLTKDKGKEVSAVESGGEIWNKCLSYEDDVNFDNHCKELDLNAALIGNGSTFGSKQWGKDWWWRQDGSDELCSKDYVMEWIGSQIYHADNPVWEDEKKCSPEKNDVDFTKHANKVDGKYENQLHEAGLESPKIGNAMEESRRWTMRDKKHRKMQEWWKEERLEEISPKETKATKNCLKVPHFGLGKRLYFKRKSTRQHNNVGDGERDFSFRRGSKKKSTHSPSSEMCSGDLFSRELSSTTSMRGTLCYVAPEYGGCGLLMEKADIYSLGVLILVIVSGRRPLHVLASPMKLEKANLISWCRHLAQAGNVLELIDEKLRDGYNKEQASLCINLALACLQKVPELRPDIGDVVQILRGEIELPPLPFEFSPSPRSKLANRSRRKNKPNAD